MLLVKLCAGGYLLPLEFPVTEAEVRNVPEMLNGIFRNGKLSINKLTENERAPVLILFYGVNIKYRSSRTRGTKPSTGQSRSPMDDSMQMLLSPKKEQYHLSCVVPVIKDTVRGVDTRVF